MQLTDLIDFHLANNFVNSPFLQRLSSIGEVSVGEFQSKKPRSVMRDTKTGQLSPLLMYTAPVILNGKAIGELKYTIESITYTGTIPGARKQTQRSLLYGCDEQVNTPQDFFKYGNRRDKWLPVPFP